MSLNNNEIKEPTIAEFYTGKNIFITGGTGFLGTVLIETLLSSTPKIGKIYLLIRDKYGSDTRERIKRLLSKQVSQTYAISNIKINICKFGVIIRLMRKKKLEMVSLELFFFCYILAFFILLIVNLSWFKV